MKRLYLLPRVLIVVTLAICLLGGLFAGLARLGWDTGNLTQNWMLVHGPLMICGFLGTLICLERAVALAGRTPWVYTVPAINAIGAAGLLIARDALASKLFITAGSVGLLLISLILLRMHYARYLLVMTFGAAAWVAGNLFWLAGYPIYHVVHFWAAFLVLTIVGERLELSRVRMLPKRIENYLLAAIALYLFGVVVSIVQIGLGIRLLGVGLVCMAIWLLRYDIARLTIKRDGLPRYIAACLLTGYLWLIVGGLIGIWYGPMYGGPIYAAFLHAILLGFVFSMIFGHAPIILPAVTGLRLNYSPVFYVHLVLLHVTLVYRTIVNLTVSPVAQQWGGLLNVVAVLLFLAVTVVSVIRSNAGAYAGKGLAPRASLSR